MGRFVHHLEEVPLEAVLGLGVASEMLARLGQIGSRVEELPTLATDRRWYHRDEVAPWPSDRREHLVGYTLIPWQAPDDALEFDLDLWRRRPGVPRARHPDIAGLSPILYVSVSVTVDCWCPMVDHNSHAVREIEWEVATIEALVGAMAEGVDALAAWSVDPGTPRRWRERAGLPDERRT
jgi:hypothetical protein